MTIIEVQPDSDFPIQNLPYGIFSTQTNPSPRVGTRLGDFVVDLSMLDEEGRFDKKYGFFDDATLNRFMAAGRDVWREIRQRLIRLLGEEQVSLKAEVLIPCLLYTSV